MVACIPQNPSSLALLSVGSEERQRPGALVFGLGANQEREQAGEEEAQGEAVAEARPPEQEGRAQAEPARRPDRPGEVPRPVQELAPAPDRSQRLAPRADAVEQHAEGPDQLEAAAPLAPLVEQGHGEDEGEDRGDRREHDPRVHGQPAVRW